jgi:hypothetical protein
MKLAFVLLHTQFYRHFDKAIRMLSSKENTADIVIEWIVKPNLTDRLLTTTQAEVKGITFVKPLYRKDSWSRLVGTTRELLDYSAYFHPEHPSKRLANRWRKYISERTWKWLEKPWMIGFLRQKMVQFALKLVETVTPPVKGISKWLRETRPEVVVLSPLVAPNSMEVEYLKAARGLGIPTVYALASWDNLTTKGTLHIQPDLVFVWNEPLKAEAVTLHGVPAEKIVITGSPTFDYWFQVKPSTSHDEFCKNAGFDPRRPYVVYLCSSRGMIEDETTFILELAHRMCKSPATQDVVLLVRPHPYNMLDLNILDEDNICVFPKQGDLPDVDDAKQIYFDTLYYSKATVGVNTSAMIEATIADKPCVTIIDERYRRSQTDMGHFRHLINGKFLQVTHNYEDAVRAIGDILEGKDPKHEERRNFVRNFIRPHGVDRPVSAIFALAVEMAAQRKPANTIMDAIRKG